MGAAIDCGIMTGGPTRDAFLDGRLELLQPRAGYRAGLDAMLLAATVAHADDDARILDLGAGVGAVGLSVAARHPGARVTLIERQPSLVELCRRNIARNGLSDRANVVAANLEGPAAALEQSDVANDAFDVVLANPPFQTEGDGRSPPDGSKADSHVMPAGGVERWLRVMARLARPGGTAAMIHRADALGELLAAFDGRFGALVVLPVHPRTGAAAVRVIVAGIKGSRAPLRLLAGLVLHHDDGHGFTPPLQAILRRGAGLDLRAAAAPALVVGHPTP